MPVPDSEKAAPVQVNVGKCPKCDKVVRGVRIEEIGIHIEHQPGASYRGVSYLCRHCNTVLSVALNPTDFRAQLVDEMIQKFKETFYPTP
jgi:phage FluMu protein Com